MSAFLRVEGLVKRFDGTVAVDRISLGLERGEMLALLGPSGSGKTTTLRLLAGFEAPDEGRVWVEQEDVTLVAPVTRRFGMVFQHYALFPHLDVRGNVAFGLESIGVRDAELGRRVDRALALVDLDGFGARRISQLSGGQQQRVALARALAPEPRVLLLDEPLSNLDPTLRERTRREIRDLIHRVGITTVLVTHEQDEAFELGDRVAVMRGGRLEQVGTPDELYGAPANAFVGGFIGRSSTAEVMVVGPADRGVRIALGGVEWEIDAVPGRASPGPGRALMLVRPEALRMTPLDPGALPVTVTARRFVGPSAVYTTRTDDGAILDVVAPPQAVPAGARVGLMPSRRVGGGIHLFPAEQG
jgi:ABC-type Fe3+/spermidine/putrescine transport system ATPase subunit